MSGDPFAPIGAGSSSTARTERKPWIPVMPVPDDAPPPPAEHFKLGKPAATWRYTDMAGGVLGYVYRFNTTGGDKVFRPLIYARPAAGGKAAWRWEAGHRNGLSTVLRDSPRGPMRRSWCVRAKSQRTQQRCS